MIQTQALDLHQFLADPTQARRIVVKIGSSSLTDATGRLNADRLEKFVAVVAERRRAGGQVVVVSSGAIAAALGVLGLTSRPRDLATAQAAASVGQGLLIAQYTQAFASHGLAVGQVLVTETDVVRRSHYRNAQTTLNRLLDLGIVPIVNENDVVATEEIRFGDNDRLAAFVSHLVRADALILATDIDSLYTGHPRNPDSRRIGLVTDMAELASVEITAPGSKVGTGGMVTKVEAATMATRAGIPVFLGAADQLRDVLNGQAVGTVFAARTKRIQTRRLWLAHAAHVRGRLTLDDGAVEAITVGQKSLLAAGVVGVDGIFDAGAPVELLSLSGRVVARGLVAYSAAELPQRLGRSSDELREEFGDGHAREVVHRDDLVVL